ncbi:MAG TPA: AgmX/PglI C-terminal domain-containing protein, partial [Polyangiaceae bacterium]|nr:AgmX/PglI C-terminal domain-containing protein [Polyangiaceae bacterium]
KYSYTMIKSGPDVDSDEVELKGVSAIEVVVLWGQTVLHVAHLHAGSSFSVGEEQGKEGGCDFFIPSEKLGTTRLLLVSGDALGPLVFVPNTADGIVELVGNQAKLVSEVRQDSQLCSSVVGGHQLRLMRGTRVKLQLADFAFHIAAVAAGKPTKKGFAAATDWKALSFFGLSSGFVGALVATMAFFMPTLADSEELDVDQNQLYLMQQYLISAAEREKEATPTEQVADQNADDREGGTGTRARGEEGAMGHPRSHAVNRRYAVAGRKDNPDPHLARTAALEEARTFGTIGLLHAGLAGDPNAPTAPWGRDESLGTDEVSYLGNMWGDQLGEAAGSGGLGLSGFGEGGGGIGEGIGLGTIGALGHGLGTGEGQGMGAGHGRLGRGHSTRAPSSMRVGVTQVSGRLPAEVIQRIVRQNYGRFRMCYEQGLARNPNLEGRVQVRFVIDREGLVSNVQNGGSDLPDSGVTGCVMSAYYGLSFPQPEGGIVTVTYPIMFQPG